MHWLGPMLELHLVLIYPINFPFAIPLRQLVLERVLSTYIAFLAILHPSLLNPPLKRKKKSKSPNHKTLATTVTSTTSIIRPLSSLAITTNILTIHYDQTLRNPTTTTARNYRKSPKTRSSIASATTNIVASPLITRHHQTSLKPHIQYQQSPSPISLHNFRCGNTTKHQNHYFKLIFWSNHCNYV